MGWKLGIITDEISEDFERALDFVVGYSLDSCELRGLWGKNIMNLGPAELDRARQHLEERHLQVAAIASPIFKYNLPEMPAHENECESFQASFTDQDTGRLLRESFRLARFFGTRQVRVFSYRRVQEPERAYPHVRERLAKAARLAGENGIVLILENEHDCNIGTGQELGRILRDIDSPYLRGNWDPGNAAILDEVPFPDGFRHLSGLLAHMHIKDVRRNSTTGKLEWAPVGGGFIDWKGQFAALRREGCEGGMSLETHYRRPDGNALESTRESLQGLFKVIQEAG